jgi:FlaA1/EpsC-like NDP-sugar epimerase
MPNLNGKLKRVIFVLMDIILVAGSLYLALYLRFEGAIPREFLLSGEHLLLPVIAINLIIFYFFGLYRRLWRYASVDELVVIFFSVCAGVMGSYIYGASRSLLLPRSVYVIFLCLLLFSLGGSRLFLRVLIEFISRAGSVGNGNGYESVLILGAGDAGVMVAKEFKKHQVQQGVRVVGFIDDDLEKQGQVIQGIPVLGTREDLREVVAERKIRELVIAMPSVSYNRLREIVELCKGFPVKLKTVPGIYEILEGKVNLQHLKKVEIEDLLGRPPVESDVEGISSYLANKTVMVTGAGGSIGSELCRQLASLEPGRLVLLDQSENDLFKIDRELGKKFPGLKLYPMVRDIQDKPSLEQVFGSLRPEVVFHAAAYKHVPLMEANPVEAVKNNVLGSKNLLDLAARFGVKHFVAISTDKAVKPKNVMGATKRVAEIYMQYKAHEDNGCAFCAVRFGNVLGSRGSVVPIFKEQIAAGGPVTVTHPEMTRYFMTIPEAVQLVIQAGAFGENGEIFVLDMGEPVKVVDLARDMITLSGLQPGRDIEIEFTGIRPGEKLVEELFSDKEGFSLTGHKRIFVAPDTNGSEKERNQELGALEELLEVDLLQLLGLQKPIRALPK